MHVPISIPTRIRTPIYILLQLPPLLILSGSVELALTGNVGGSYDYPGDPAYNNNNDDPVVTFNEVDDSDDDEYDDNGPIPRSVGKPITTFQPLCPFVRRTVELDPTIYRESSYTVIDCLHPYRPEGGSRHNKVCGGAGFSCIQRNRTIILVKRKHNQNCWETEARTINTGCDCMWPKHQMGDIEPYHG